MLDLHWVPGGAAVGGMGLEGGVLGRGEEGGLLAPPHHTHISAAVDALFTRVPQELHKPSLLHKPSRSTPLQTIQPSIQFEVSHAGRPLAHSINQDLSRAIAQERGESDGDGRNDRSGKTDEPLRPWCPQE